MKLNNRGYLLIEVILAFVITFTVAYIITNLVFEFKDTNDDLIVETLVKTEQGIISNKLMKYMRSEKKDFSCGSLTKKDNTLIYNENIIELVDDKSILGNIECDNSDNVINVNIELQVLQVDEDFNINVRYRY